MGTLSLSVPQAPIVTVMRRLLTGHAVSFNRRHRRYGHLFQNRYKSIQCQEDPYLLELVRSIHVKSNERILGDGALVEKILVESQDRYESRYALQARGIDVDHVAARVAELLGIQAAQVW